MPNAEMSTDTTQKYEAYLKSKGKDIPERPDWEGFRSSVKEGTGEDVGAAPSDIADVHLKLRSGLLGGVVGTVTDTVGGVTGGLLK